MGCKGSVCKDRLHDSMLAGIMRSPISFFDATPAGRILNRFSKDVDEMDVRMPFFSEFIFQAFFFCASQMIVVCVIFPFFAIPLAAILCVFFGLDIFLNEGVRQTKKLENRAKSPVLHHLSSAMAGIAIIRGYQRQSLFQKRFQWDLNFHLSSKVLFSFSNLWYMFRMDLIGMLTIVITGMFAIANRSTITPGMAGLALSNVFLTGTFIPFLMRMKAEFMARFNSVERISEYALLESEAAARIPETAPPSDWPSKGSITFEKVSFRYRKGLPLVLRDIDIEIKPEEKIGIVGRTGAGKTSLVSTLLRMAELESGTITIDKIDTSKIGLMDLRSAIAVIPQDPVLFQGTIRYNLDPFNNYDDASIWIAVEKSHLKSKITALSMAVDSEGDNFSVGEKQLICLARALLRGNKILILDEATANVDVKTDYLIQEAIREAFAECTVLTVAHRINTVANYDKIVVMDAGEIVEFGSPSELSEKSGGIFASMMKSLAGNNGEKDART